MTFILSFIDRKVWRGGVLGAAVSVCLAAGLLGCGSSTTSSSTAKTTGLKKRALVSNQFSSAVQLLDAQNDKFATAIRVTSPTRMLTRSIVTAVVDASTNTIAFIDSSSETVKVQPAMAGTIDDIALSGDGKTAYAAMRNLSQLAIINVPDGTFVTVAIPGITRLVLSPNSSKLLMFSDDAQALPVPNNDCFFVLDATTHSVITIKGTVGAQPYSAVFNGSDTSAFILNCAGECGGTNTGLPGGTPTTASLRALDLTLASPLGGTFPLPLGAGATVGLLSGQNMFLAGTPSAGAGSLVVFNTASLSFSTVLTIQDGLHTRMALTSNGRLYVGSLNCLAVPSGGSFQGCLAILDTSKGVIQSALAFPVFSAFRTGFSVTGLQPISGRNVIYVVEGGELDIFDITTNAFSATQLDVVGNAVDVVQIDP